MIEGRLTRPLVPLTGVTLRPGDSYVNSGKYCVVLAVYLAGWSSRIIVPSHVDTVLVLEGLKVWTLEASHVQTLVELQRKMDRGVRLE